MLIPVALSDTDLTIGRARGNAIALAHDLQASRRHAVLRLVEGRPVIVDLNSENGLFVNGRRVQQQELGQGDSILVGQTRLEWRDGRLWVPGTAGRTGQALGAEPRPALVGAAASSRTRILRKPALLAGAVTLVGLLALAIYVRAPRSDAPAGGGTTVLLGAPEGHSAGAETDAAGSGDVGGAARPIDEASPTPLLFIGPGATDTAAPPARTAATRPAGPTAVPATATATVTAGQSQPAVVIRPTKPSATKPIPPSAAVGETAAPTVPTAEPPLPSDTPDVRPTVITVVVTELPGSPPTP